MTERPSITALIPTFNCEEYIRDCLESVRWVDEILVVDSFSTDGTLTVCKEYTDRILQHEYVNSATQKNWALQHVRTDWVLQLDSDERVEPALQEEIQGILRSSPPHDGYYVRRKNLVWGQWTRCCGQYPDHQLRLLRPTARWSDREVHARVLGVSNPGHLEHHIIHYDLDDLSAELQQFARQVVVWECKELVKTGKRWRWLDVTLWPVAKFFLAYVVQGGYREGFRGFFLSVYCAFYAFMTYARLFEHEVRQGIRN